MSYADDPDGWHRLRDGYSQMLDDELLELNNQFDGLTDDAQGLLRNELSRRKLSAAPGAPSDVGEAAFVLDAAESEDEADTYFPSELLQMGGVPLCECDTTDEANFACFILTEANIESTIRDYAGRSDLRLPQVLVAPEDLEKAKQILSRADLAELRPRFEAELAIASADFALPKCPSCSSEEVLLKSVDPTNSWICENCGAAWREPPLRQDAAG